VRALRVFACTIGAAFDAEISIDALPPKRIQLSSLFDLHRRGGIKRITVSQGQPPVVSFHLQAETGIIEVDLNQISQELGGGMVAVISRERS
jgi:hypothetical protein